VLFALDCHYLAFRTLPPGQDELWVRKEIFSIFSANPTVVSQELCRIAFGELKVPYGHAVLTLFDNLNAGDTSGVIFCGRKSSKLLSIPSTILIDKKNAICALTALAGQSPASQFAKDASPALQSLVDRARRARFDERAQFARPTCPVLAVIRRTLSVLFLR
jgi:hypothetical protein